MRFHLLFVSVGTIALACCTVATAKGPLPLDQQRRLAEKAGYRVTSGPDAPQAGATDAAPKLEYPADAQAAGAAMFVRDYNLPIYPDSRVGQAELTAAGSPLIDVAREQAEPLSLGVHALADLDDLTVTVGPLELAKAAAQGPKAKALPAEAVTVGYMEDAYIQAGGRREGGRAVLTPLRLRPVVGLPLAKGVNRQFWITVSAPATAAAGDYRGTITVASKGRPALARPLTVHVRDFTLVDKGPFVGAFMTLRSVPNRATLADFKAHGIDGLLWFYSETSWKITRDGDTIKQDFSTLGGILDDMAAVGMKGPVVVGLGNDSKGYYERELAKLFNRPLRPAKAVDGKTAQVCALDDEVINKLYVEGIRQLSQFTHSKKGWPEVILLHYDEATERLIPEATHRYKLIKQADPRMRVYGVTMNKLDWAKEVAPLSDILVCNGDFNGIRDLGSKLGKDVWGYSGAAAAIGEGGSRFNIGLRLYRYGLKAHWFWCYNFYPADPWDEFAGRAGDASWVTVYPADQPGLSADHVPTLAWEGIRAGRDDIRYIETVKDLLSRTSGPVHDEVAAGLAKFIKDIPEGRDRTVFRTDQEDFYATLPGYHRLTPMRRQLADWIDQLRVLPTNAK